VSIRSPCLHLAQQMTTLLPPDTHRVHTRCPGAFSLSVPSTQQHFSVLCCRRDQVLISLAIFFFSHPCSVFAAVSASLMCILSYAYLASLFLFTNLCSDPSFLGADKSKPLVPSVARYASSPHSFLPLPLSDTRWTLPLSLDHSPFTFWLHSFDHLFVNVFSIDPDYCSLSVLMAHLLRSNPTFAHLTNNFVPLFCLWCHKQIVASLASLQSPLASMTVPFVIIDVV
jgi:hypothetical protein